MENVFLGISDMYQNEHFEKEEFLKRELFNGTSHMYPNEKKKLNGR